MSLDKLVADIDDQIKRLTIARSALVSGPAPAAAPAARAVKTAKKGGYHPTPEQKKHLSEVMKARWANRTKAAKKAAKKVARA